LKYLQYIILFTIPFFTICGAEFHGSVSAGTHYDTNIRYLYLPERISYGEERPVKKSFFIDTEGEIQADLDSWSFRYNLYSNAATDFPEQSRLNHYFGTYFNTLIRDDIHFTASLLFHHRAENYNVRSGNFSLETLFIDQSLNLEFFYDHSDYLSLYAGLKELYYKDISDKVKNLNGPVAGLETGVYFYPGADFNYLKTSIAGEISFLRKWYLTVYRDNILNRELQTENKFFKLSAEVEVYWKLGFLELPAIFKYSRFFWIKEDRFTLFDENGEGMSFGRKRGDHLFHFNPSVAYNFKEQFRFSILYELKKNISNIGEKAEDYTDYSYTQHLLGVNFSFIF